MIAVFSNKIPLAYNIKLSILVAGNDEGAAIHPEANVAVVLLTTVAVNCLFVFI